MNILLQWIETGKQESPDELADRLSMMIKKHGSRWINYCDFSSFCGIFRQITINGRFPTTAPHDLQPIRQGFQSGSFHHQLL